MNTSKTYKRYIITLIIILLSSITSALLLFYYMDPESNIYISLTTMWIASFLSLGSFFSLLIYFFKRIYYRWEIYISNLSSSLRQWILMALYILWIVTFYTMWVYNIKTASLLFVVMLFIELVFQSF